jgi:hypothetical protein
MVKALIGAKKMRRTNKLIRFKGGFMYKRLGDESGIVLIVVIALLFMLSLIGIMSITTSNTDMTIAGNEFNQTGAFYAAEAGLEKAAANIIHTYQTTGVPPSPLPSGTSSELNYTFTYSAVEDGPAVNTQLTAGSYEGLYGLVKSFTINSCGVNNPDSSIVELEMGIQDALIPLFQFAVFYEYDLEIAPGPDMTLGGRVHTNKDLYIQAGSNLYIDSYMSAAGSIYHGRKDGSGQSTTNNHVYIRDDNSVYQSMRNGDGSFLDSRDGDWVNESLGRWGGRVEDSHHGITELYMPVVADGPATDLIDRGQDNADSYEHRAGLKFIDGVAYYKQADGSWLNITSTLVSNGVMSYTTFYDARESRDVSSLDISVDKLNASPYFPSNGIIYSSTEYSHSQVNALRLKNGSELARSLTIATDNPLYTLGNYNTVNKKPASLITDALTILSNNWDDSKSWGWLSGRNAGATQVNACYMTGNTETGSPGHDYSGGFENLPRFLENWSGIDFTWRGAAVDLWYSRQNTGAWGGDYYKPPNRDWAFDSSLLDPANLPPGTPLVNIVQKTKWAQK